MIDKRDMVEDVEDKMMQCWNVVEDLDVLNYVSESQDLVPMIEGLKKLYQAKFERLQVAVEALYEPFNMALSSSLADNIDLYDYDIDDVSIVSMDSDGLDLATADDYITFTLSDEPVKVYDV
jgi:hypothetical protein